MGMISERHVQAIWYDERFRPERLYTRSGQAVEVLYPGDWNGLAGPDFSNARLKIGGRLTVGDVEVHLVPRDWDQHGHGIDDRYRNVIAHVVWRCGERPKTLPPQAVTIWLGRFMTGEFSTEQIDLARYPQALLPPAARPCRQQLAEDRDAATATLLDAGWRRLYGKAARIGELLAGESVKQVFYSELLAALGYSANSKCFRRIASAIPYNVLRSEPQNAAAALVAAAGFFGAECSRVRPHNRPEVRLRAAAALMTESDVMDLIESTDFAPASCRSMLGSITAGGLVGRGRAAAIIANVVLPFAIACGNVSKMPAWLPPEDVCSPVRRVARRIFGCDHNPGALYAANGILIQGMIGIARDWCDRLHPVCHGCGVAPYLSFPKSFEKVNTEARTSATTPTDCTTAMEAKPSSNP